MPTSLETSPQLLDNIAFVLEDAHVLGKNGSVVDNLKKVTNFMRTAIAKADPRTVLSFINAETYESMQMTLFDIDVSPDGMPLFAVAAHEEPYAGALEKFAIFGWQTKARVVYTAFYPNIAFYPPDASYSN